MGKRKPVVFDLSISLDYVADWSLSDAIRELYQNALDSKTQFGGEIIEGYSPEYLSMMIGNKGAYLEKSSLLLGTSSKRNDNNTLGVHGEGYKLAAVVLIKLGYTLTIYNTLKGEIWRAVIKDSSKYGAKILAFEVSDMTVKELKTYPDTLMFEVGNMDMLEYKDLRNYNLHLLQKYTETFTEAEDFSKGVLLRQPELKGQIFVGGLYVLSRPDFKYGYNLPVGIKLDRDRNNIDVYEMLQGIVKILYCQPDGAELLSTMIEENAPECQFVRYDITRVIQEVQDEQGGDANSIFNSMVDKLFDSYEELYGEDLYFSTSDAEIASLKERGYNAIHVSDNVFSMIRYSDRYKIPPEDTKDTYSKLYEDMQGWYSSNSIFLATSGSASFESLLERFKVLNGKYL